MYVTSTDPDATVAVDVFEIADPSSGVEPIGLASTVLINPDVVERDGLQLKEEGCLSVPGIEATVARPLRLTVRAQDRDGEMREIRAEGLLARAIQHEIDHLNGILFLDHLSLIRRQMLLAKWRREHKDDTGYIKEVEPESASTD